jgi:hypothetical protein
MSQQAHEHYKQANAAASQNALVRFRQRFERHFNEFWERYGLLLKQVIVHRRGRLIASLAMLLCALYLGYSIYDGRNDAAALHPERPEETVRTVTVIRPKPVPATETITLPGNIVGW